MRVTNWEDRLYATLADHRISPFVWGQYDCARLFADVVEAVTGVDPLAGHEWDGEFSALRRLNEIGCRSMHEFVAQRFDQIVPADARRGDIGYPSHITPLMAPAIVVGAEAVSRDDRGWIIIPREMITMAYRVG